MKPTTTIKVLHVDQLFGDLDLTHGQFTAAHEQIRIETERELAVFKLAEAAESVPQAAHAPDRHTSRHGDRAGQIHTRSELRQ